MLEKLNALQARKSELMDQLNISVYLRELIEYSGDGSLSLGCYTLDYKKNWVFFTIKEGELV